MIKAAVYARYSSDLQTDASIEDQIRVTEERAKREGWNIIGSYTDHGVSGASMMRPGIQMLMQDAAAGKFHIVLTEALDRLSRDQEDIAGIYKRLQFADVKIITLSEGEISNLHIGLKGTMNALFLKDLADKTRRGLRGKIENGKSGGGITYGYDVVKKLAPNGDPLHGERVINEQEAKIVHRIFAEYTEGKSPLAIAKQLNKEGIKGPSANTGWCQSTINGNRSRGTGILNNELYIGQLVWNRLRYIKAPDTGKRVSRLNPEDQWIRKDVPDLRIVDQALWDKVRERQASLDKKPQLTDTQRPRLLFSNLLKCGCCGGGYTKISANHYGCFTARKKEMCLNMKNIRQDELEKSILNALQNHLMASELCDAFCKEYTNYMNTLRIKHNGALSGYKAELAKLERRKKQIVDAIYDGMPTAMLKGEADRMVTRMQEIQEILNNTEEAPTLIHPNMSQRYHKEVQALITSLNTPDHRHEAADLIRGLVKKIVLTPKEGESKLTIDLYGDLAGILNVAIGSDKSPAEKNEIIRQAKWLAGSDDSVETGVQDLLVAGAGFEPAAFRL